MVSNEGGGFPLADGQTSDQGKCGLIGRGNPGVSHPPAFGPGSRRPRSVGIVRRRRSARAGKGRMTTSEATRTKGADRLIRARFSIVDERSVRTASECSVLLSIGYELS